MVELVTKLVNPMETKGDSSHVIAIDKHGFAAANEGPQ